MSSIAGTKTELAMQVSQLIWKAAAEYSEATQCDDNLSYNTYLWSIFFCSIKRTISGYDITSTVRDTMIPSECFIFELDPMLDADVLGLASGMLEAIENDFTAGGWDAFRPEDAIKILKLSRYAKEHMTVQEAFGMFEPSASELLAFQNSLNNLHADVTAVIRTFSAQQIGTAQMRRLERQRLVEELERPSVYQPHPVTEEKGVSDYGTLIGFVLGMLTLIVIVVLRAIYGA